MKRLPSLLPLLLLAWSAHAGVARHFDRISVEQGLSSSEVSSLAQDRLGFIWVGTKFGLNRLDGTDVTRFFHDPGDPDSLSGNHVCDLEMGADDQLWAATWGSGITRLDLKRNAFECYLHDPADPGSLAGNRVWSVLEDREGRLWAATDRGLSRLDRATGRFAHYRHSPSDAQTLSGDYLTVLAEDAAGDLWVGTQGHGLNRLDPQSGRVQRFRHDPTNPGSLGSDEVFSLLVDAEGVLWVGTHAGLDRLAPGAAAFGHYPHVPDDPDTPGRDNILWIAEAPGGGLWLGTGGGGPDLFDPATGKTRRRPFSASTPGDLATAVVLEVLVDADGNTWLATLGGLYSHVPGRYRFEHYHHDRADPGSPGHEQVHAIHQDAASRVWVAGGGGSLQRFHPGQRRFETVELPFDSTILGLASDERGRLWMATEGAGLVAYDPVSGQVERHVHRPGAAGGIDNNTLWSLAFDATRQALWLGVTTAGLHRLDLPTGGLTHYRAERRDPDTRVLEWISTLLVDRTGRVWAGAEGGLVVVDPQTGKVTGLPELDESGQGLIATDVHALFEDDLGQLWIGSNQGLSRYDPQTGAFRHFPHAADRSGNRVVAIEGDGTGRLWLATNRGLAAFDPAQGTLRSFGPADGLLPGGYLPGASARLADGTLLFGGHGGLTRFHPGRLGANRVAPRPVLTELRLGNERVEPGAGSVLSSDIAYTQVLRLGYRQRSLRLGLTGIGWWAPQRNRYAYRLDGFDRDWITADHRARTATYTNLDPGDYRFRFKAANSDGRWSGERVLALSIAAPWWERPGWRVLLLCLLGGLGYLLWRWRLGAVEAKSRELERQVSARTRELAAERDRAETLRHAAELANQTKDRFLAHVSHDLRRPLTAIVGNAGLLRDRPSLDREGREQCELIQSQGWQLTHLVDDLLDAAAIRAGRVQSKLTLQELPALLAEVAAVARAGAEAKGLEFVQRLDPELPERIETDGQRLCQILLNLLDNAIKYTGQGRVVLEVRIAERSGKRLRLLFAVEDTGPGIAELDRQRIFAPFEQPDPGKPGAGLGLAIGREFAELLGGRLTLASGPARGSRFELSLPVTLQQPMAVPSRLDLAALLDFAERGERALISEWCSGIAGADPHFEPFAERVRALSGQPDLGELVQWLEQQ